MDRRKIYALDSEVYTLFINKIAYKFEMGMSGYFIRHNLGYLFIKKEALDDKNITIEFNLCIDGIYKPENKTQYTFSKEYSKRVKFLLYDKIDEINDSWKKEQIKIKKYIEILDNYKEEKRELESN